MTGIVAPTPPEPTVQVWVDANHVSWNVTIGTDGKFVAVKAPTGRPKPGQS